MQVVSFIRALHSGRSPGLVSGGVRRGHLYLICLPGEDHLFLKWRKVPKDPTGTLTLHIVLCWHMR